MAGIISMVGIISVAVQSLVPLIEVINTKIMCRFSATKFCVP